MIRGDETNNGMKEKRRENDSFTLFQFLPVHPARPDPCSCSSADSASRCPPTWWNNFFQIFHQILSDECFRQYIAITTTAMNYHIN